MFRSVRRCDLMNNTLILTKLLKISRCVLSTPSDLRHLIFSPLCLSTKALKHLNSSSTSLFYLTRYVQAFLVKSSTKNTKYLLPLEVSVCMGPHTSECTTLSLLVAFCGRYFENFPLFVYIEHTLYTHFQAL